MVADVDGMEECGTHPEQLLREQVALGAQHITHGAVVSGEGVQPVCQPVHQRLSKHPQELHGAQYPLHHVTAACEWGVWGDWVVGRKVLEGQPVGDTQPQSPGPTHLPPRPLGPRLTPPLVRLLGIGCWSAPGIPAAPPPRTRTRTRLDSPTGSCCACSRTCSCRRRLSTDWALVTHAWYAICRPGPLG